MEPPANHMCRWLAGSAFVDDAGDPTRFYHGTDCLEPFTIFTRWEAEYSIGFHFGDALSANARISQIAMDGDSSNSIIVPVICRATNPLLLQDHHTWSLKNVLGELDALGIIPEALGDLIYEYGDHLLFAALEMAGHDAVIYANTTEIGAEGGHSLFVWRAELLKSPFSEIFELDDPRLMSQVPARDIDLQDHRGLADEIEMAKAMIAEHFPHWPQSGANVTASR